MADAHSGYDLRLVSQNPATDLFLKVVRRGGDALSFRLGDSPDEPGVRGNVGTIPIDNVHHGLGSDLSIESDRYLMSNNWSALRPGRIELIGNRVEPAGEGGGANLTEPTETTRVFATSFQWQNNIFFILPTRVIFYAYPSPSWAYIAVAAANRIFRGPAAFYQGRWIWGLEDGNGLSVGHCIYDTNTGVVTVHDATVDATKVKLSVAHSAHAALWGIQVTTVIVRKGEIGWKMKLTDAQDPSANANWTDQTVELWTPFPTNMYVFGRWLAVFCADGQILGISETPPNKTLVPPGILASDDPEFGVHARQFGEWLLVPSRTGLHAIPFTDNRLRDFAPQNVQGRLGKEVIRPACMTPYGMDFLVGTRSEAAAPFDTRILGLRRYPEGVFYNQLLRAQLITTGAHVLRAMEVIPTTGRALLLLGNATNGKLVLQGLPPPIGGRPPSALLSGVPGLATSSEMRTSYTPTRSTGRALFTQIRGWAEDVVPAPDGTLQVKISVDNGAFSAGASINAAGPFVGTLVKPIGRLFSLQILGTVTADDGTRWPVLLLPMFVDYVEEPAAGFRLEFDVIGGGGARRFGSRDRFPDQLATVLKALQGFLAAITRLETKTVYNTVIEQVEMVEIRPATGREGSQAAIRVTAKVIA